MRTVLRQLTILLCLLSTTSGAYAGLKEGQAAFEAKDYPTALKEFEPLAKQGNAEAQVSLGNLYYNGKGVAQDYRQAAAWFQKAAEQGHANGQISLGNMYAIGLGVTKDDRQAAAWFQKAAEQGYAEAQFSLGYQYAKGQGVAKDEQQAAAWLQKAAAQGHALNQTQFDYLKTQGIAVHPFRKADEQEQTPTSAAEESLLLQAQQQLSGGDRMAAFKLYARAFSESASTGTRNKAVQGLALVYPALKPPPGLPEDARRHLVQAEGYVEDKNYAKALDLIEQALRTAPWWANAYFDKALIHAERREYALATLSMQRFMTLAPGSEKAREAQDKIYKWEPRLKQ